MSDGVAFDGMLRLTTVRWQSDSAAVCGAILINQDGTVARAHINYSLKLPSAVQAVEPRPGQIWRVVGTQKERRYTRSHFEILELQVLARRAA